MDKSSTSSAILIGEIDVGVANQRNLEAELHNWFSYGLASKGLVLLSPDHALQAISKESSLLEARTMRKDSLAESVVGGRFQVLDGRR